MSLRFSFDVLLSRNFVNGSVLKTISKVNGNWDLKLKYILVKFKNILIARPSNKQAWTRDEMATERSSFHFNSIIPQTYKSKAEAFARCLHDKLISLGGVATFTRYAAEMQVNPGNADIFADSLRSAKCKKQPTCLRNELGKEETSPKRCRDLVREEETASMESMVNYNAPCRVLRESSSTSDLEKYFADNMYVSKKFSRSGDSLNDRMDEGAKPEDRRESSKEACDDCQFRDVHEIHVAAEEEIGTDTQTKLRRCSSLKTWKTPPGTPGEKKIVRFADALGLDLADVRTFLDEIPKIPSSAYVDLKCTNSFAAIPPNPTLIPKFVQPGTQMDFLEKVRNGNVCLENAVLTDTAVLTVSGCVRVRNFSYEKAVHIRYTIDNWESFSDLQATYIPNSCDGFSDKFSFVLYGHTLKIGGKLEFAIRLDCCGAHFWDNNSGNNYVFECLPQSPSTSQFTDVPLSPTDTWSTFY